MKTYKLIAAGLLTLCFSISLWHSEVFSSIPETTAEVTAQSAVQPDTTGKHRLVQMARERGMVRIGVTYNMEHSPERYLGGGQRHAQRQQIAQMHDAFVNELQNKRLNVKIGGKLETYPRIFLSVDEEALLYLYKSELVKSIDVVRRGQRFLSESTTLVGSQNANMLDIDGNGQVIVIMDDGVDSGHSAFSGRVNVNNGACFSENDSEAGLSSLCPGGAESAFGFDAGEPCDDFDVECDHGTHVAGIAAGDEGVAPGADIVSIQVFSKTVNPAECEGGNAPCLTWSDETLEQALDHINTRPWLSDVTAINMSFGLIVENTPFTQVCDDRNTTVTDLIDDIFHWSEGAYVVAASGNNGFTNGAAFPACISSVISVGATDSTDGHWQQSNAASYLDLVAPGVDITSAIPGGGTATFSGTSMAAPHVAGTLALIRQAYPLLTPAAVQEKLYDNLEKVSGMQGQPRTDEYGRGRLNAYASVLDALEQNPSVTLVEQNWEIFGTENFYNDEFIYVLPGAKLTVSGTLNLDHAYLYVLGTLEGNGCIELFGDAAIIDTYGENEFPPENIGDCDVDPEPVYPTVSDTTFTQSTVLADTLMLTGVTTLDPGVTVTVAENNLVIVADTLQMNGSGSSISIFASSGELRLSEGIYVNGGRLLAHSEGEIDIEEEAILQSTSLTIQSGGKAIIGDDAVINTNGGDIVIHLGAELQVLDNVSIGMDSASLQVNGDAVIGDSFTFTNGHISTSSSSSLYIGNNAQLEFAETPSGILAIQDPGFVVRGAFSILGNCTMQPYNNQSGGWHGLSLIGNGANGSSVSNAQISGSTHGVRLIGVQDINLSGTQITNHQTAGLFISGSDDINLYEIIVSGSENDGMVTNQSTIIVNSASSPNRFENNDGDGLVADGISFLTFDGASVIKNNR